MDKPKKQVEYAALLIPKIAEIFDEDSDSHIDLKELLEGEENLTQFLHALANIVPCHFYNKFTQESKTFLEFNHIANHLVVQYAIEVAIEEQQEKQEQDED